MLRTEEQLAGIRESARINTALLDYISENIAEGNVHGRDRPWYTALRQTTTPSRSLSCTKVFRRAYASASTMWCATASQHKGIPAQRDIVNVDVSTIYKGYFSDASRMYMIGEVSRRYKRLVQVTRECRDIGAWAAQPWARLGDAGAPPFQSMPRRTATAWCDPLRAWAWVSRFHEEPDVEHFGKRGTGHADSTRHDVHHRADD